MAGQASAAIQNARLYNQTDEALARRVEQLQALLDGMQEGVLMVDVNGRIALINPFAAHCWANQPPTFHRMPEMAPCPNWLHEGRLGSTIGRPPSQARAIQRQPETFT